MAFDLTPDQQRHAQISGGMATKNYNGFGVKADYGPQILKLLKTGEKSITEISKRLHLQYFNTQKHLMRLVDAGQAEAIPSLKNGRKFFRVAEALAASEKTQRYQREFHELRRDPFELRDLAMATRHKYG